MKITSSWVLLLGLVVGLSSCDSGEEEKVEKTDECLTASSSTNGQVVDDQYIISLPADEEHNSGRKSLKAVALLQKHALGEERIINQFTGANANFVLRLSPAEATALATDPAILFIERDKKVSLCACFTVIEPRLVTWNVDKVGYGDGKDKTAWILDTGVDLKHADLNVDTLRSRSFVEDAFTAQDDNGHGTHVAGVVGAKNNNVGTLGVASGAKIVALKVLDTDGNGILSAVLDALAYVKKNAKPGEAVNISLGVEEMSDILDNEVKALAGAGIYVAIAAGNEGEPAGNYSPGRSNGANIYTVSAVDSLDRYASFSNYGNESIDFAAPGVRILSTYIFGKYAIMSGTSMATPHVTGLLLINQGKVNSQGNALNDPDGVADPIAHK